MKEKVVEMEERLNKIETSSQRQLVPATQRAQLAQEALRKCRDDLRGVTQDLGYKRSALNRAQEMNAEYEAELRELRTLKENSGDADILKRELSGYLSLDVTYCRGDELRETARNDIEEIRC
jgi:hypothetical protein